ncbi:MAG: ABC transporter ATP-binding protein [Deltaproteobacteria bacterium RBG_16_49_23]|nr:MAG: ABC transporter ATP-binding protein [Deltaproteobacteria bacterium RBG_16_49_23]
MLEVKNLMVFFENALALNDFSMAVERGEIVGVLGSNSAGKTTLMNTISGLILDMKKKEERRGGERISVLGELKFEGEDILNKKPSERVKKGIVLSRERHPIFRDSDVVENLKIAGYLHKRHEVKERIDLTFKLFPHLQGMKKRKAGLMSGGEQQMLAIGIALVAKPRLLLMDEPLLGLSPMLQADLVRAIKNIRLAGITVLVTEQFARTLLPIIDRGYVIENGMLVFEGSRQELFDNPEVKSAYLGI